MAEHLELGSQLGLPLPAGLGLGRQLRCPGPRRLQLRGLGLDPPVLILRGTGKLLLRLLQLPATLGRLVELALGLLEFFLGPVALLLDAPQLLFELTRLAGVALFQLGPATLDFPKLFVVLGLELLGNAIALDFRFCLLLAQLLPQFVQLGRINLEPLAQLGQAGRLGLVFPAPEGMLLAILVQLRFRGVDLPAAALQLLAGAAQLLALGANPLPKLLEFGAGLALRLFPLNEPLLELAPRLGHDLVLTRRCLHVPVDLRASPSRPLAALRRLACDPFHLLRQFRLRLGNLPAVRSQKRIHLPALGGKLASERVDPALFDGSRGRVFHVRR